MQVFLCWSGDRSKAVAETFAKWIVQVIQAVEPWISAGIEKGTRWSEEVAAKLEESRVGIICLTKENPNERWILFESGAIAKTKDARVCTLLLDIDPSDVQQPLGSFQHTTARDKNDVRKLLQTINTAVDKCGEKALSESVLDGVFETNWPRLSAALEKIASQRPPSGAAKRSERQILEEILEIVRGQERRVAEGARAEAVETLEVAKNLILRGRLGSNVAAKLVTRLDNLVELIGPVDNELRDKYLHVAEALVDHARNASGPDGSRDEDDDLSLPQ